MAGAFSAKRAGYGALADAEQRIDEDKARTRAHAPAHAPAQRGGRRAEHTATLRAVTARRL